jgi:hypothetical protein
MPNFDLGPEYNQVKAFSQVNIICESAEQKIRAAMNATTVWNQAYLYTIMFSMVKII